MSTAPSPGWKAPLAMRQGRSNRPVTARHPLGLAPNSWARTVVKNGKGVQQFLRCFAPTSSPNVQLRVTPRLSPLLLYSARGREYVPESLSPLLLYSARGREYVRQLSPNDCNASLFF